MVFPLNFFSAYVGFPILIGLAVEFYLRYRKNQNDSTLLLMFACLLAALSQLFLALPILIIKDSKSLSFYAYFADIFIATSFLLIWLFSIHAFLGTKPKTARVATIFVFILTIACYISAFPLNLNPPYSTSLMMSSDGVSSIFFRNSLDYTILFSIDRVALLLVGLYLFIQSKNAPTNGQRLRIRSFALLITLAIVTSAIMPIVKIGVFQLNDIILSSAFILCGFMAIIGHHLNTKEQSTAKIG